MLRFGMRKVLLLAALGLLVLALAADFRAAAEDGAAAGVETATKKKKRKKRRRKKKKKKALPEVSLSRYEYCHACIGTVEQFHKAVEDVANSREFKRDVKNNEINGTDIANNLCDGPYFEHYTDEMRYGCYKLLQDHWNTVIGGMRGTRHRGERNRVLEHKRKACVETEACIGHMADKINRNVLPKRTKCNACKAVVGDIDWLLFREKQKVPRRARLSDLLDDVCGDIAIRHDDSGFLEELCDDLLDAMIGESLEEEHSILVRSIKLRKSLEGGGLKLTISLQEKVCEQLANYCDEGEAKPLPETDGDSGSGDEDGADDSPKEETATDSTAGEL